MEVDGASCSSIRTTARSPSPETTPNGGSEKQKVTANPPSTAASPLRAPDSILPAPINEKPRKRTTSAGSILGKRNASAMEQAEPVPRENACYMDTPFGAANQGGKHRPQAVDQVVSAVFRRESMISPMDPVAQSSGSAAATEAPSSSRDASLGLLRRLSSANVQEGDISASLPGFKSLFGALETEKPTISRHNSSGFPDLQTLKGPLTLASTSFSRTSHDSGITSTTTWSSRSSYDTRHSISTNLTAPPSAVLSASALPPGTSEESHSPWSTGIPLQKLGDPPFSGLGLTQSPVTSERAELSGSNTFTAPLDLSKRPSYANFGFNLDPRRTADEEEAWRRQSDNAMVLSAERRRLLGSSPRSLSRKELPPLQTTDPAPDPTEEDASRMRSRTAADEALLAARARMLRYESYPFGSKEGQDARLTDLPATMDSQRRQSMFPHQSGTAGKIPSVVDLTNSPGIPSSVPASPFNRTLQDQLPQAASDAKRDMQFDEIMRKASVDLAHRSATSSVTGTPLGTVRPLLLPSDKANPVSMPAAPTSHAAAIKSDAEIANAREREQRQQLLARYNSIPTAGLSRGGIASPSSHGPALPATHDSALPRHQQHYASIEGQPEHRRDMAGGITHVPNFYETPHHDTGPIDMGQRRRQGSKRGSPRIPANRADTQFPGSSHSSPRHQYTFGQRVYAGPSIETHQIPASHQVPGPHRRESWHPTSRQSEVVVPYYDNPEPPHTGLAHERASFPSVLRKDYQPEHLAAGLGHGGSPFDGPPPAHITDQNQQALAHYGHPPPPHHFRPPNFDNGMPFTSVPPTAARTLSTPAVFSLNSSALPGPRYTCDHCGKSFSRPSSLKIHIYSHTGEKPYKCTWQNCTRSFSVQSNLKRHAKVHLENSGQQAPTGGNQTHHMDPVNTALRGLGAVGTPGGSASSYTSSFLTPQTAQPLAAGHTPDGYFDSRLHARHPASHSPAPASMRHNSNMVPYPPPQAGAMPNSGNGQRRAMPSHLQFATQGSQSRRVSGPSGYDSEMAEEDELEE
ncbi:hypothetical protein NCC49_003978 [Naganishia albida]|nr:hypothetical protein NCC49_003978 [Naganishia albida]